MVILGALGLVIVVIVGAWFLVLRRLDDENFEAGGPLHPPWTRRKAAQEREIPNEQAALRARSAERQLEPEHHAGAGKAIDEAKDRGAARGWGG